MNVTSYFKSCRNLKYPKDNVIEISSEESMVHTPKENLKSKFKRIYTVEQMRLNAIMSGQHRGTSNVLDGLNHKIIGIVRTCATT